MVVFGVEGVVERERLLPALRLRRKRRLTC